MADLAGQVWELARVYAGGGLSLLHVTCERGAMSFREYDATGRSSSSGLSFPLFQILTRLEKSLRPAGGDGPMVLELRLDDSGGYEFRHSADLVSMSPARLILDPDYRHPHHPRPGMPAPEGVAVTDRPTDPAVLATVRALVEEFVARYTEIKGRAPDFGAGRSEQEILAAERAMGLRLPEDVRALYRLIESDLGEHGLLGAQELLRLDDVVNGYLEGTPGSYGWDDDLFTVSPVVYASRPAGRIRRVSRSDWWVTIATDRGGNWCAVDLDPGPDGTPGQLLEYGRDTIGPVGYVAESVTAVLRAVVAALRAGDYHSDDDPDYPFLATTERIGGSTGTPYLHSESVGDRSVRAVVAGLSDPLRVQQLYFNDADALDLPDLAPLHNLRAISVNRAGTVDLALPHDLPVESLSVEARVADSALLAGHPTLWRLTLKGLAAPVRVEPLAALPALAHLDLSGVEVADLERVATLPQLRVLALDQRQWSYLRDHDVPPTGLAAAELSGPTPLADAIDWAGWLATSRPVRPAAGLVRGRLDHAP